ALEKIKKCTDNGNPFAFVIMDLTIPGGMGGKETIRELRNFDKNIIAFVSSGYSEDPIMANPREYGFNDKLPKPFKKIELEEKMLKYS
ncbi:MAG: response regulator, partial [Leptospiraceae bacterium]|nr:response regulator [Leptospiraceae bacterium]